MIHGYIESEWEDFREKVIHKAAGPQQIIESRRCFYAGAQSLRSIMMTRFTSDPDLMDQIELEMAEFQMAVKRGEK